MTREVSVEISWTEVVARTTQVNIKLDDDRLEDLEAGYGFGEPFWAQAVRVEEGGVEILHNEVDHVEILECLSDCCEAGRAGEEGLA